MTTQPNREPNPAAAPACCGAVPAATAPEPAPEPASQTCCGREAARAADACCAPAAKAHAVASGAGCC